ncbi:unnamed protein product, partial [Amoebophrya sp. A25]|eukprot:GSA25T00008253001.1
MGDHHEMGGFLTLTQHEHHDRATHKNIKFHASSSSPDLRGRGFTQQPNLAPVKKDDRRSDEDVSEDDSAEDE